MGIIIKRNIPTIMESRMESHVLSLAITLKHREIATKMGDSSSFVKMHRTRFPAEKPDISKERPAIAPPRKLPTTKHKSIAMAPREQMSVLEIT